jgi:hypothetical protein
VTEAHQEARPSKVQAALAMRRSNTRRQPPSSAPPPTTSSHQ